MSDMPLNIMCQENRFTEIVTLHGSIILDGLLIAGGPAHLLP